MNPSLITIIIPVFNRAKLLPETLDSVLRQIYSERDIADSRKLGYDVLAEKLNLLLKKYLKHNKNNIRLIRYRIGSFFFKIIPLPNLFLVYEIKNPFLKTLIQNTKRAYKNLFNRGYLKNKRSVSLPKIRQNEST